MKVAVIGTGNVGGVLGTRLARLGHKVAFGTRGPGSERIGTLLSAAGPNASAASPAAAAGTAEVVILAVPWPTAEAVVRSLGRLSGKILVDCTNPLTPTWDLALGLDTSAGEMVAGWASEARVVKAFNTTGAGNMADPDYGAEKPSMFLCGDDSPAKVAVSRLTEELGFEPVDCGPLTSARYLEPLCGLWITLAYKQGLGPDLAFRLIRRPKRDSMA